MTFLQHVGGILKKILHIGEEAAIIAAPAIQIAFPEIAPIYNSAIGLAMGAEATTSATTGTGPQRLAQVTSTLVPQVQAWAAQNGIVWPDAEITKWTSAVVDTLNMIPQPTTTPTTPAA
jgi:hypothetical protein